MRMRRKTETRKPSSSHGISNAGTSVRPSGHRSLSLSMSVSIVATLTRNVMILIRRKANQKTRQELAQDAGVGTRTIDRAVQVEKVGRSEEVIAGKKTATQVLAEEKDGVWCFISCKMRRLDISR